MTNCQMVPGRAGIGYCTFRWFDMCYNPRLMLRVGRGFADKAMRKAMVLKPLMFGADDWAEAVAVVDGARPRH